jgi:hypothetical protein
MTNNPKISMSPEELPQQRIHEVAELPVSPEPFDCHVGYGKVPADLVPCLKSAPSRAGKDAGLRSGVHGFHDNSFAQRKAHHADRLD